jgi:hypothetical protein
MQVNGPEDEALGRDAVNWQLHEDNVRRLRGRIFKAAQEQDLAKLRSLHLNRPRGLLEPCASTRRTHGSQGGGAQQCVPPTRLRCILEYITGLHPNPTRHARTGGVCVQAG